MPEANHGRRSFTPARKLHEPLHEGLDAEVAVWLVAHAQQQRRLETLRKEMEVLGLEWIWAGPRA
jgi:hypothetical protein